MFMCYFNSILNIENNINKDDKIILLAAYLHKKFPFFLSVENHLGVNVQEKQTEALSELQGYFGKQSFFLCVLAFRSQGITENGAFTGKHRPS